MSYGNYEFRYVRGHIEVFLYGVFQFSADTSSVLTRMYGQK